jgi:hypothetical protein
MNYDQWRKREFREIGCSSEIPTETFYLAESKAYKADGPSLSIHLHSLPSREGCDPTVLVKAHVSKMPLERLAQNRTDYLGSGLYKKDAQEGHKYWFWRYDLHLGTSRFDLGNYSYYRRDVKLNDTEILHAYAEVLNAGPQESRDADHAAVKRMLDSIQPLNVTTNK